VEYNKKVQLSLTNPNDASASPVYNSE